MKLRVPQSPNSYSGLHAPIVSVTPVRDTLSPIPKLELPPAMCPSFCLPIWPVFFSFHSGAQPISTVTAPTFRKQILDAAIKEAQEGLTTFDDSE
ncbi:hypothetical protein B0H16DRAFT_1745967 [Mycena metata]|uniref:Uncharacterized protein n=1 Tax=Mycena metata TaxID=1033252 RepID=A0AAD7MBE4_9AGAR|nr:hypothetical protein B0H16DRAFT_1745967 [Mycena metata]